jgi:hypothetical protein
MCTYNKIKYSKTDRIQITWQNCTILKYSEIFSALSSSTHHIISGASNSHITAALVDGNTGGLKVNGQRHNLASVLHHRDLFNAANNNDTVLGVHASGLTAQLDVRRLVLVALQTDALDAVVDAARKQCRVGGTHAVDLVAVSGALHAVVRSCIIVSFSFMSMMILVEKILKLSMKNIMVFYLRLRPRL